jgi:O-antigen/teichoic acid export membrane protein
MGLIFVPVYIKYLGIESYGLIGFFASMQAWFALLDMGMTPTLGREIARFTGGSRSVESIRNLLRSIEIITLIIVSILSMVVFFSSDWLSTSWLTTTKASNKTISDAIKIISVVIGIRFFEGIYRSVILGLQKHLIFNIANCILATIRSVGAICVLACLSATIQAFFIWQGIFSLISVITLFLITYSSIPASQQPTKFSFSELIQIRKFAGGMSLNVFLAIALMNLDKTLLSKFLTLSEFGYYTLSATIAGGLYMIIMPTEQVFYPKFCELHARGDLDGLKVIFHKAAQIISVLVGSAGFLLIFFGAPIVQLWTQNSEIVQHTKQLISVLALANIISGVLLIVHILQLTYGWTRISVYVNVINLVLFVPAIFWCVPKFGGLGAAFIWLALNVGGIIISVHFTFRKIFSSEKWKWYWQDVVLPIFSAAFILCIAKFILPSPQTNFERIFIVLFALIIALCFSTLVASQLRLSILLNIKKYMFKRVD